MLETFSLQRELPPTAGGAVQIVRKLTAAGHRALLAGGCVRDLLLGQSPEDFDVATSALPEEVSSLFRATRQVGAQFGVVLVKQKRQWVEVATFRSEGPYLDGRRPSTVSPTDAEHDALRRDFTVNGMFLDPASMQVHDYVGGRDDLQARVLRAIGVPAERFAEDYLRLLRAVRFAGRLDFPIEAETLAAIRSHAPKLAQVAPERVRDELERMLTAPSRSQAWRLLDECELLPYLWPGAGWDRSRVVRIETLLTRLGAEASLPLVLAVMLEDREPAEIERLGRALTLSNEERETTSWLVIHLADLADPARPSLAEFKRLMAHPAFDELCKLTVARYADCPDAEERITLLEKRCAAISPDAIDPPPLVTGDDLIARGVAPGPVYKQVLSELYTRQLEEQIQTRDAALEVLDELLAGQSLE